MFPEIKQGEIEKIEFRSEEVQDILGGTPHWIIRSGSGYLLAILVLTLAFTWFIKYPDVIKAPAILTSKTPPMSIIAERSSYISLWVQDKDTVKEGQYMGYLNSPVNVRNILDLKDGLDSFRINYYRDPVFLENYSMKEWLSVGELQNEYDIFLRSIRDYQFAIQQLSYRKQIVSINNQIAGYNLLANQVKEQNTIMYNEIELATNKSRRDSILFKQAVTAKADFESARIEYLRNLRAFKSAQSGLTNTYIQISQLRGRIQELTSEEQKQKKDLLLGIELAMTQLEARLKQWEQQYMLKASINGRVAFFKYWSDNQYVKAGEEVLSIIPSANDCFIQAKVPAHGTGKIKAGQRVNVIFDSYPSDEYGMVRGIVQSISLLQKENIYLVTIQLPTGLITTYGKRLEFKNEISGEAQIITEDLRLLQRFIYRIRR